MLPKLSRVRIAFAVALSLAVVAGCTGDDDGGDAQGPTVASSDGSAPTTDASPTTEAAPSTTVDVEIEELKKCTWFDQDDAADFMGEPATEVNTSGSERFVEGALRVNCAYLPADDQNVLDGVTVSIRRVPGAGANPEVDMLALEQGEFAGVVLAVVEDLGDIARYADLGELGVLIAFQGEDDVRVHHGRNATLDDAIALMREVLPRIPTFDRQAGAGEPSSTTS